MSPSPTSPPPPINPGGTPYDREAPLFGSVGISGRSEERVAWHLVGDPGEPDFITIPSDQGEIERWIRPGDPFPGAGSIWTPEPGTYRAEHKGWAVPPLAFFKDSKGFVHLRGGAVGLANPYSLWDEEETPTNWGEVEGLDEEELREGRVFVLPPGYRPAEQHIGGWRNVVIEEGTADEEEQALTVLPSGLVAVGLHLEGGIGLADDILCFDGVSFRAA